LVSRGRVSEAGAGSIRLRAWGQNAESLIDPLLETLQSLPIGQRPEIKRTKAIALHATVRASASVTVRLVSALPDIVEHAGSKRVDRPAQIKLEDLIFAPDPFMKDFFVSYTKTDKAWAEWIAWTLEAAGYSTVIAEFQSAALSGRSWSSRSSRNRSRAAIAS
jgi:TIR domain